ncbi:MAG: type II toxin-antitoxin system HipA family toxin [Betaproteobacteria bacterium]|nr:type II toxin-antitoxin system HipA family toxin [Betaproteobacteria bacterium]
MADARVLKILLGDVPVGHLTGFQDGKSLFAFDDSYIDLGPGRPTLSLSFNGPGDEEATERKLREIYSSRMKLPPFFSNLLPEGVLREYMVKRLKIHHDHEFDILMALGASLPGAVRALPADELPQAAIHYRPGSTHAASDETPIKFSLGGSQLKYSMIERGGRFTLADGNDEWIVKPPHPTHANVPANEYTMMRLAAATGIQTPEVKLVKLDDVDPGGLAGLFMQQREAWAYAVKRYDRTVNGRVHVEDFAQVFNVYGDQEYKATNYDTIGRLIFDLFPNRFEQLAEFIRRLVVNILIGNGDAHLKNWSVIYQDKVAPQLAPAYDLLSTLHYVANDSLALNLAGEKRFESIDASHFDRLARRMEAPPKFVLGIVRETLENAQKAWPGIIRETGLPENMRERLYSYWGGLSEALRIRP